MTATRTPIRKAIATFITSAIAATGLAAFAAPANAAEPYVTRAEFGQVKKGMPIKKVHRIFDTSGKQSMYFSAYPSLGIKAQQSREYRTKSRYGFVSVDFVKRNGTWVLKSKTAYWG